MFTVDDLTAELGVSTEDALEACQRLGIVASSGGSGLSGDEHERLRAALGGNAALPPVVRGSTARVPHADDAPDPRTLRERLNDLTPTPTRRRPDQRRIVRIAVYTCLLVAVAFAVVMLNDRKDDPVTVPSVHGFTAADVGRCVDLPTAAGAPQIRVTSCDVAHDAEIIAVETVADRDDDIFPGTDPLSAEAEPICGAAFETYVGSDYDSSNLDVVILLPSAATWSIGDRSVLCLAEDPSAPLVGSVADAER